MANILANIFGESPVMPLENHSDIVYRCARSLKPFFVAAIDGNWDEAARIHEQIRNLEHEADDLKKSIRLHLPKSLFMPVPRQDILELLMVQDRIANRARDVSGLMMLRKMLIPEAISTDFLKLVDRVIDAAKKSRKSMRELDELYTVGFRGAEVDLVSAMIEELDQIETDTDAQQVELSKSIFAIENTLEPVHTMFLYRVIELIGDVADMAERVGRRLELLLSH